MSNLFILLKNSFINNTGINSLSTGIDSTKEKKKLLITTCMYIFIGGLMAGMSVSYSFAMAQVLKEIGHLELILVLAVLVYSLISFITSIFKAQGTLFNAKDYDLLMALPIKSSTILSSKIIGIMGINYGAAILIILPASIVYYIFNGQLSSVFFIMLIISLIFIPMIPMVLASLVAVIITFLSSRFRYKNIATTIVGMIFFIGVMLVSFNMQNYINKFMANSDAIISSISKIYIPATIFKDAIVNLNFIALAMLIAVSFIPFLLFIFIFGKTYKNLNGRLSETYKKANYKVEDLGTNSPVKAIVIQELRRYFSTSIYVMNTAFGSVMLLMAAIATLFADKQIEVIMSFQELVQLIPVSVIAANIFMVGVSNTTCSSISLEGSRLWIIKSLPIDIKDIFKGKIIMNLIITVPVVIIANILFGIGLNLSVLDVIGIIIVSVLFATISAILGLIFNLNFPKMEWTNPTAVVKQGAAVLINMVATLISVVAIAGVWFLLYRIDVIVAMVVMTMLLMLTIILSWKSLNSSGVRKFNGL